MLKYIPSLDGLRGIAILLVMLFHLEVPGFSLGWSGVPLFFVLSGFLITGILLQEKERGFGDFLRSFYLKRTLRIFPLFYAYLAVNFVLLVATHRSTAGYGWYVTYLQNYQMGIALYAGKLLPGMVGHTWSLAVEEQFYLAWPFLVYFLNRRHLIVVCALLTLAAPAVRWAILQHNGNVYLANITLPSCIDMMAYGGLLALLRGSKAGHGTVCVMFVVGGALAAYAIATLGLAAFWEPVNWVKPAFYLFTALAFIFGMLIWLAHASPDSVVSRALSIHPLLFTGKISYGLYMWHLLCFSAVKKLASKFDLLTSPIVLAVMSIVVAYAVATLSFFCFETYFLRMKDRLLKTRQTA